MVQPTNSATTNNALGGGSPHRGGSRARWAGDIGIGLIVLGLVAFVAALVFGGPLGLNSMGFNAMVGVTILSLGLYGLIALTRAFGLADPKQALALPSGSVRALLAFAMAIVFVSVASWTLGGLFDPLGPVVAKFDVKKDSDDEKSRLGQYSDKQYVILTSEKDGTDTHIVYLRREAPPDSVIDLAKYIVTVSSTVLVTIIGFYFGSKSASDAVQSANDSLSAFSKAIGGPGNDSKVGDGGDAAQSATPDDIRKTAGAVADLSTSVQSAVQDLGDAPLALLHRAADGRDDLKDQLSAAASSFATLDARANTIAALAAQAKPLASTSDGIDAKSTQAADTSARKLLADATAARDDFVAAQKAFVVAHDAILSATAK